MATLQATQVVQRLPIPSACGYEEIHIFGDFTIPTGIAANDIVEMVGLPAGYVPTSVVVDCESLGGTMTAAVGLMSGTYGSNSASRTSGAEFMTGKAFGTAGVYSADVAGSHRIAPTTADRSIGIKFTTVTTPTVGAKVRLGLRARPALEGA